MAIRDLSVVRISHRTMSFKECRQHCPEMGKKEYQKLLTGQHGKLITTDAHYDLGKPGSEILFKVMTNIPRNATGRWSPNGADTYQCWVYTDGLEKWHILDFLNGNNRIPKRYKLMTIHLNSETRAKIRTEIEEFASKL